MRIPWPRRAREPRFCSARILLPPCSPSRPSRLHWARPGWPSGARAPVLSSADTIANASRRTTMSRPQGIPTRAAAFTLLTALVLATTAHAARPRFEDEALERPARPRPTLAIPEHWTLGQPVRFPRELLPLIMGEMEVPITEPAPEPASVLRSLIPAPESRGDATPFGGNRLLNDPTHDPPPQTGPPSATQSENSLAAHGRFLASGWNDSFEPRTPRRFSRFGVFSDGGRTGHDGGPLPPAGADDQFFGDPSLTVDEDGNFYSRSLYARPGTTLRAPVRRGPSA